MKKWFAAYRSYMVRPILYKCVFRAVIAFTALLLWEHLVISPGRTGLHLINDGCLTTGVIFLGFAWFSYLHMDGISPALLFRKKQEKKKPKRGDHDIVDFADEHIVSFAELEDDERILCSLMANLVCGILYLAAAVVGIMIV